MIPKIVKDSLDEYVEKRVPTGGFLRACLANDFMKAVGKADSINQNYLVDIATYIYNEMPSGCWGSYEIVDKWLKNRSHKHE